jgi:hypothetical protein
MIQANWRIAEPLLADVLAMRRAGWTQAHPELEERKLMEDKPRRLGITEEMGIAHMSSDGETDRIHLGYIIHGSAVAVPKHRLYIVHSGVQLLAHRRSEPAPMSLRIIIRVAMQEEDIVVVLETPTNNK